MGDRGGMAINNIYSRSSAGSTGDRRFPEGMAELRHNHLLVAGNPRQVGLYGPTNGGPSTLLSDALFCVGVKPRAGGQGAPAGPMARNASSSRTGSQVIYQHQVPDITSERQGAKGRDPMRDGARASGVLDMQEGRRSLQLSSSRQGRDTGAGAAASSVPRQNAVAIAAGPMPVTAVWPRAADTNALTYREFVRRSTDAGGATSAAWAWSRAASGGAPRQRSAERPGNATESIEKTHSQGKPGSAERPGERPGNAPERQLFSEKLRSQGKSRSPETVDGHKKQGLNACHTAMVYRDSAVAKTFDQEADIRPFSRAASGGRRRLASPPNAPASARNMHGQDPPISAGEEVSPPSAPAALSGDPRSSPRGIMTCGLLPTHGRVPISMLVKRTQAGGCTASVPTAVGRARGGSRGPSPETIHSARTDVGKERAPRARENVQKASALPAKTAAGKKVVMGAEKDKEKSEHKEKSEPELPVPAAAGTIKIDTSRAHSLFYLPCLKRTTRHLKFLELVTAKGNDASVAIYWHDQLHHPLTKFHMCRLGEGQHMNRFLAMQHMARKNALAKRLKRMQMLFPNEYNFMPQTWRFPWDVPLFKKQAKKTDDNTGELRYYILKPDNGSKGQGIRLTDHASVLKTWARMSSGSQEATSDDDDECTPRKRSKRKPKPKPKRGKLQMPNFLEGQGRQVCTQEYLQPYLLDGFKFDMRLYVVLASVNPMRGYLCRVGMVRKAMVAYQEPDETNVKQLHMHLTNTSLNCKFSAQDSSDDEDDEEEEEDEEEEDDDDDDDDDSEEESDSDDEPPDCKRFLSDVMEELKSQGVDTQALWQEITRIVQLTLNAIHPDVALSYSTAFQKSPANQEMFFRSHARKNQKKGSSCGVDGDGVREQSCSTGEREWHEAEKLQGQLFSSMLDGEKCFQILGFDIFLDKNCKPYLLEINHNPSFKLPTQLDVEIKTAAMAGCLGIICNKYMPYPSEALGPKAPGDGNDGCRERSVSLDSAHAAASEAAAVAAVLERDREALFRNTGLGKRQLQQQEVFAPSSYTRLKSSNSEVAESSSPQIASLCTDASGGQVISSRDWSLKTLYDCVGSPPNTLQVMELARILFEGICSRALMQSQKEALKGLEFQNQVAFGKPPAAPVAGKKSASAAQVAFGSKSDGMVSRRVGEWHHSGELRTQDYSLLQDLLSRARLPQGCGTCAQMESIKRLFVAKRTAAATVLQLDGFCDGLVSLAETISECLLSGNAELDLIPWSLESKAEGLKDITHILHRLIGRLIAILNQAN